MIRKLILSAAIALVVLPNAFADGDGKKAADKSWFVGAGAGVNIGANGFLSGTPDVNFGFPGLQLSAGKWVSPIYGIRLSVLGLSGKTFDTKLSYNFVGVPVDFLVNASGLLWKADGDSFYNLYPYVSVAPYFGEKTAIGGGAGLLNSFRINDSWNAFVDLRAMVMKQNLTGEENGGIFANNAVNIGLMYRFGGASAPAAVSTSAGSQAGASGAAASGVAASGVAGSGVVSGGTGTATTGGQVSQGSGSVKPAQGGYTSLQPAEPYVPGDYTGGVKGTLITRGTKEPVQGALLNVYSGAELIASVRSDDAGQFAVNSLRDGMYTVVVDASEYLQNAVNVTVNGGYVKNMFNISLTPSQKLENQDDSNLMEFDLDDSGYNDSPTVIFGSNDIFNNIAGYGFGSVRFKTRGYLSESQDVYLAGVKMNDAMTGYSPYSLWSGLNEATRSKETTMGNEIAEVGFSGYNGSTNIFANALSMRKGFRTSVLTNSQFYRLRLMASYATGRLDNGWAYAFNFSGRFGGNDWIKGVYYRSFAYYAAAEKIFDDTHKLGFAFFGTPGERGKQMGSTQEVYDLVGNNMYNANWGYQNGVVRNSRVAKTHEPIALVKYDYTPSDEFRASVTALYRFGRNGNTALDWYDAADPRPDYYRNLPSYFYSEISDLNRHNMEKAAWAYEVWNNPSSYPEYTQVNWDRLYHVNRQSLDEFGNKRSKYVVQERRVDQNDFNLAVNARYKPLSFLTVNGGFSAKINRTEYYTLVDDLLGGDYFVNINNFAERDFGADPLAVQNDLDYYLSHGNTPQKVMVGDKYGYDYYAHVHNYEGWANAKYSNGNLSANVAGKIGYNSFWREGIWRNGLFPDSSQGDSERQNFLTFGAKAGVNYVIGGNARVFANVGYYNDAPKFNQAFLSPRTRNDVAPGLTTVKTLAADINAQYVANGYNVRATAFYATIKDQIDLMSFYDDLQNAFTNFSMTGIDERHLGVELGFRVPVPISGLAVQGALSAGEYIYTSNPLMTQTVDNSSEVVIDNQVVPYWKESPIYNKDIDGNYTWEVGKTEKHYVPSTPQTAASLGLAWNKNFWFVELDLQHFRNSYLDMNPFYRTDQATAGPDSQISPEEIMDLTRQEKFQPSWLLNFSVGKSWFIRYKYQLGFNLNVKNLLNNTDVRTGGYEQTRLVDNTVSKTRYYRFDSKYFYMSGLNYMLNIYFKF